MQRGKKMNNRHNDKVYTEPEFSSKISKSSSVLRPVAVEIYTAILTSLKHLQCNATQ